MTISSLRVETLVAVTAHHNQIQRRLAVKHRPHSCQVKVYRVVDATAGRAGIGCRSQHLGAQAFGSRNWRRASTAARTRLMSRLLLAEQQAGTEHVETVTTAPDCHLS